MQRSSFTETLSLVLQVCFVQFRVGRGREGDQGASRQAYLSHAGLASYSAQIAQIICRKVPRRETSGGAARASATTRHGLRHMFSLRNSVKRLAGNVSG